MTPLNSPVHGLGVSTGEVRTSVFRLKSNPASKDDGLNSPMNSGSNESVGEASDANLDWMLAGVSLKLSVAGWHVAHVRPLPRNVSLLNKFAPCVAGLAAGIEIDTPDVFTGAGAALSRKSELWPVF